MCGTCRLLEKDPATRLTARQAMQHPWTSAQGLAPLRPLRLHHVRSRQGGLQQQQQQQQKQQNNTACSSWAHLPAAASAQSQQQAPQLQQEVRPPLADVDMDDKSASATAKSSAAAPFAAAPAPWRQSALQPNVPGVPQHVSATGAGTTSASRLAASAPMWVASATTAVAGAGGSQRGRQQGRAMMDTEDVAEAMFGLEDDDDEDEGRGSDCKGDDDDEGHWELRRSVTDEELEAAISSCIHSSAAVLMEGIFTDVTFPKG